MRTGGIAFGPQVPITEVTGIESIPANTIVGNFSDVDARPQVYTKAQYLNWIGGNDGLTQAVADIRYLLAIGGYSAVFGAIRPTWNSGTGQNDWAWIDDSNHDPIFQSADGTLFDSIITASDTDLTLTFKKAGTSIDAFDLTGALVMVPDESFGGSDDIRVIGGSIGAGQSSIKLIAQGVQGVISRIVDSVNGGYTWGLAAGGSSGCSVSYDKTTGLLTVTHPTASTINKYVGLAKQQSATAGVTDIWIVHSVTTSSFAIKRFNSSGTLQTGDPSSSVCSVVFERPGSITWNPRTTNVGGGRNLWVFGAMRRAA